MQWQTSKNLTISVIIPAYNAEKTISACVNSLKNQTNKPYEIIVVDDGSTDLTGVIAREQKVKVITLVKNHGRSYARNMGVKKAKGTYIAFLDSDSIADTNWLFYLSRTLRSHDIVSDRRSVYQPNTFYLSCLQANYDIIYNFRYHPKCGWAMKKSLFEKIGGFDEAILAGEEHDLGRRVMEAGFTIGFEPRAIQYHNGPPRSFLDGLYRRFDHAKRKITFTKKYTNSLPLRPLILTMFFFLLAGLSIISVFYIPFFLFYITIWYTSILVHQGILRRGFWVVPVKLAVGLSAIRITEQIAEALGYAAGVFLKRKRHYLRQDAAISANTSQ